MTADLSALIARLEAAKVGGRELDAHVEVAARAFEAAKTGLARKHWAKWIVSRDFWVEDEHTAYQPAPATTSLDAALALAERVLPGCCVLVGDYKGLANHTRWNGEGDARATKGWCSLSPDDAASSNHRVHAHTPALALCIAVLKAKQGEGE